MRNRKMATAALLLTLMTGSPSFALDFGSRRSSPVKSKQNSILAKERFILTEINRVRSNRGLPELKVNGELQEIARRHSSDMASSGYFSHTDQTGRGLKERLGQAQRTPFVAGENLHRNDFPDSAREAIRGWIQSPGHRQNILNGNYSETGIGVAVDSRGLVFFTQIFLGR
jgi:uncharacterized protein YkwD